MPASEEREQSRDRGSMVLSHQPSFSESISSRSSVPMWDSSDPDRAPPPLPLNPSLSGPATKPNTSPAVASIAESFVAKTRDSIFATPPSPQKSPEKSLIKNQYHRRMQSAHGGAVKDLSAYLENVRSPDRSPERSPERLHRASHDLRNDSSPSRAGTPTGKDLGKEMPGLRPASRPPLKAILSESPQSPAMRALQGTPLSSSAAGTPLPEPAHESTTATPGSAANGSTALVRTPPSFDALSTQIHSLTNIATNLQREMAALSRRSKDNASDLVSLKDATSSRDEDIRKSLRDLVTNLTLKLPTEGGSGGGDPHRTPRQNHVKSPGSYLLEDKAHGSPKSFSLPRIPSPASFAASIDREMAGGSPNPYAVDGAAAIALLEKILREMSTKEGVEKLTASVAELAAKEPTDASGSGVAKQLEEILKLLKDNSQSLALVKHHGGAGGGKPPPQLGWNADGSPNLSVARAPRNMTPLGTQTRHASANLEGQRARGGPDPSGDEVFKLLKRLKDSITEGGGLTAEIKALVRELRGEVLGMGREIGRKLDAAETAQQTQAEGDAQRPGRDEIAQIVDQGLSELSGQLNRVMQEHRRQSAASATSKSQEQVQEIHRAVQTALREFPMPEPAAPNAGIEREEILDAVREAWETYKPEIELQNFGLERDEILLCLQEGLKEHRTKSDAKKPSSATYDDVLDAVKKGLEGFKPPPPIEPVPPITKDEIMSTVRECLETFDFPVGPTSTTRGDLDMTRDDVLEAIREGFMEQPPVTREIDLSRDDLFDAVRAGLEGSEHPAGKMQELIDDMRRGFQDYSSANGRDTEQVLDALKDGLESLRADVETYVDRAADVTNKDEIIDAVRKSLEELRIDLEGSIDRSRAAAAPPDSSELLDVMEKEFEHLRSTISASVPRDEGPALGKEELLDAIRDGFDEVKRRSPTSSALGDEEALATVKEELRHMRETLAGVLTRSGGAALDRDEILESIRECFDKAQLTAGQPPRGRAESVLSNTSELLDAFNEGLEGLKVDVDRIVNKPIDMTVNYEILDTLKDGLAALRADMDRLRASQVQTDRPATSRGGEVVVADPETAVKSLSRPDIENLEVMITQLKIKVDAMDGMAASTPNAGDNALRTDLGKLEEMMRDIQASVSALADREPSMTEGAASKDDVYAIETLLRNLQAKIDEDGSLDGSARSEQIESIDTTLKSVKEAMDDLTVRQDTDAVSKQDLGLLEAMLKEVQAGVGEMREKFNDEGIKKVDVETFGLLCTDTKTAITELAPKVDALAMQSEVQNLHAMIKDFTEKVEEEAGLTAQAFEARKIEHGGIADKVEEVKAFLADVRAELKSKVEGSTTGIEGITVSLTAIGEAITTANLSTSLTELKETLDKEFARHHENHELFKGEAEEHRDALLKRHDEHKEAVVADLTGQIDQRFDELMTKYDDAQIEANRRATALDDRSHEHAESIAATKAIADDLRLLVDTLGTSVTEACKSMGDDSRTVYTRVEDVDAKLDDVLGQLHSGAGAAAAAAAAADPAEHQLTRAELSKLHVAIEALQAHAREHQPKVLDALAEVLGLVGQHYEHAQKSKDELVASVNAIPGAIPMPALPAPAAATPPPPPPPVVERELPAAERYDDSQVHAKLDRLVTHATEAAEVANQYEALAELKSQGASIAAKLDALLQSRETPAVATADAGRTREADEASVALEKRLAQKDAVELEIVRLSEERNGRADEKTDLMASIEQLRAEERAMAAAKTRVQAELSSAETALRIRREEIAYLETRAEEMERRIMESVMSNSRSLLLGSRPSSLQSLNLKRVASGASTATVTTTSHAAPSTVGDAARVRPPRSGTPPAGAESAVSSAVSVALKKRAPPSANTTPKGSRRILSLSTLGGNKGGGAGNAERSMVLARAAGGPAGAAAAAKGATLAGTGPLKRSHSVKSSFPASRKSSWGGSKQLGLYADADAGAASDDKENSVLEEDEESDDEDARDGAGTERRSSYTGTCAGTDAGTESCAGTGTESYAGTGTESYTTGTASESFVSSSGTGDAEDRRTSYAPSTVGTVGMPGLEEDPAEHEDGDGDEGERGLQLYTGDNAGEGDAASDDRSRDGKSHRSRSTAGTDSGLGSDLPTATLEGRFLLGQ